MNENYEHIWSLLEKSYHDKRRRPNGEKFTGILSVIQFLKKTGATHRLYGNTSHDSLTISCTAKYSPKKNAVCIDNEKNNNLTFIFHDQKTPKVILKTKVPEDNFEETLEHYLKLLESSEQDQSDSIE